MKADPRSMRVSLLASAVSALALHLLPVFAQSQYALSGSFARNFGTLLHLPVVGNTPCNLTIMSAPGGAVVPAYTTPGSPSSTRRRSSRRRRASPSPGRPHRRRRRCPASASSAPTPGPARPRASADFTWCLGDPNCTGIRQATKPAIIKVTAGPNRFGGTMSAVVAAGPEPSRLVIAAGLGAVGFAPIATPGSRPTGRGYVAASGRSLRTNASAGTAPVGRIRCLGEVRG